MPVTSASVAWVAVPAGLVIAWKMASAASARKRAAERLYRDRQPGDRTPEVAPRRADDLWSSWLERWLFVSGFRSAVAVPRFLLEQAVALVVATVLTVIVARSGILEQGVEWLLEIPGGVGDFLAPVLSAAPGILFLLVALLPISRVRSRRREIVKSVERDIPMTLALLSTLVESGLGFDAAVARVLQSLSEERPLAADLQLFRSETQSGVPRVTCFRRLAKRLDVRSVSTFVSAMIHSEQVGGGIAESLKRQADEVWTRRRDLAIQRAQTLPTKLSVPLVLCFLPGIFVYTFGPALAQFLRIAENVTTGGQ